jgi:hypothetical protein
LLLLLLEVPWVLLLPAAEICWWAEQLGLQLQLLGRHDLLWIHAWAV